MVLDKVKESREHYRVRKQLEELTKEELAQKYMYQKKNDDIIFWIMYLICVIGVCLIGFTAIDGIKEVRAENSALMDYTVDVVGDHVCMNNGYGISTGDWHKIDEGMLIECEKGNMLIRHNGAMK